MRRVLLSGGDRIAMLVGLGFSATAVGGYHRMHADLVSARSATFHQQSEVRLARLVGKLELQRERLGALVAFSQAGGTLDVARFERFGTQILNDDMIGLCLHDREEQLVLSLAAGKGPCDAYRPLERAQVVGGDEAAFLMSKAVESTSGALLGVVSIAFDMHGLSLDDRPAGFVERMVLSDVAKNLTLEYAHHGDTWAPATQSLASSSAAVHYGQVGRFGDVSFVYVTVLPSSAPALPGLVAALVAAVGWVLAGYIRLLASRNRAIEAEVDWRTRELSQFAYRTSHDLRGPLESIVGLCRAMEEDVADGDVSELSDNVQRVHGQAKRLSSLVRDILDLSRADLEHAKETEVHLVERIEAALDVVHSSYPDHGVDIAWSAPGVPFMVPQARVDQLLVNLLSNAVKYADPDKDEAKVELTVDYDGDSLLLTVQDNGVGIPEDKLPLVFDAFRRFHPQLGAGSGLGLTIVKRHTDALDGRVQIQSDETGTRVEVAWCARPVPTHPE